jgi:outer membrane protein assembly factor BamB
LLWKYDAGVRAYPPNRKLGVFASPAVSGREVYTASDRLIALDIDSGKLRWERIIGDPEKTHEYFWAPPLVHGSRLYAGVSGGSESDTRARLVCLNAASGVLMWEFFTVAPDVAGGALMAPPSIDFGTMTLFATTGSPFRLRPGPLRYSCSLIALDAITGKLRWADQVHPHDTRNLDLNCPAMLITASRNGRPARLIVVGGKDGIRAWDRTTRKRLWHVQLTPAPQSVVRDARLNPQKKTDEAEHATTGPEFGPTASADGMVFLASNNNAAKTCQIAGLDAGSGEIRWLHCLSAFQLGPISVANGIVYLGLIDGKLRAWRAGNGELLWESPQFQPIAGGPAIARGMVFVGTGAGEYLPGNRLLAFGV